VFAISPVLAEDCQETNTYIGDVCDQSTAANGSKAGPYTGTISVPISVTYEVAGCTLDCTHCTWEACTLNRSDSIVVHVPLNPSASEKTYWWVGYHITGRVFLTTAIGGPCYSQNAVAEMPCVRTETVPIAATSPPAPVLCP